MIEHHPEYAPQALWSLLGVTATTSQAAAAVFAIPVPTDVMLFGTAAIGASGGALLCGLGSAGGVKEKVATGIGALGMGVMPGPLLTHVLISKYSMDPESFRVALIGVSFVVALLGWPAYKFFRALFEAADARAGDGLGIVAAALKFFLGRKK